MNTRQCVEIEMVDNENDAILLFLNTIENRLQMDNISYLENLNKQNSLKYRRKHSSYYSKSQSMGLSAEKIRKKLTKASRSRA